MKLLLYVVLGLLGVWLQITLAPSLAIFGIKPNLALLTLLAAGVRWREPWLFIYAALVGLALDALTHGALGVYGISFFVTAIVARQAGGSIYENNAFTGILAVAALSVLQGLISTTLFYVLDAGVPWWRWTMLRVLPEAFYNALLAPLALLALERVERVARVQPD